MRCLYIPHFLFVRAVKESIVAGRQMLNPLKVMGWLGQLSLSPSTNWTNFSNNGERSSLPNKHYLEYRKELQYAATWFFLQRHIQTERSYFFKCWKESIIEILLCKAICAQLCFRSLELLKQYFSVDEIWRLNKLKHNLMTKHSLLSYHKPLILKHAICWKLFILFLSITESDLQNSCVKCTPY